MKNIRLFALFLALSVPFALPAAAPARVRPAGGPVLDAPVFAPTGAPEGNVSVAVGDFDEDGLDDVATGNVRAASVSILLNDGAGGLREPRVVETPLTTPRLAAADFDGDGHLDLLATSYTSATVAVLLGGGDGSFRAAAPVEACRTSDAVAADFDGDGAIDVAVAGVDCASIGILRGDGRGGLSLPTFYPTGAALRFVAGDVNGDGRPDLVGNRGEFAFEVWLNDGAGGFGAPTHFGAYFDTAALALADLNGDGFLDVIAGYRSEYSVGTFLGDGAGRFRDGVRVEIPVNPIAVRPADFDGDGRLDVAALSYTSNGRFQILTGDGEGGLEPATAALETTACPQTMEIGDFDGDARTDFAFADGCEPSAGVLLGKNVTATFDVCVASAETGERFKAVTRVPPSDPAYGFWEYHTSVNGVASGWADVVARTGRKIRLKDAGSSIFKLAATFDLSRGTAVVTVKAKTPNYHVKYGLTSSTYTDGGCP